MRHQLTHGLTDPEGEQAAPPRPKARTLGLGGQPATPVPAKPRQRGSPWASHGNRYALPTACPQVSDCSQALQRTNLNLHIHDSRYKGVYLLLSVNPVGVITGFGYAPASTKDQPLAETFLAVRHQPHPRLPSVGAPAQGPYVTDKGFEGAAWHHQWRHAYGAEVICAPKRNSKRPWSRPWHRWLARLRQIVETVNGGLHHGFRLDRERPHDLSGFGARLAAKVALHNFCIWFNEQLDRPRLAFADLIDW